MLVALLLGGCGFAPGLHFDSAQLAASSGTAAADAPPPGALINITPDLIREQRMQQGGLSASVEHLFGTARPYTIGPPTWSTSSSGTIPSWCSLRPAQP